MMREKRDLILGKRARRIVATATAFTFLCQNFAWAVCPELRLGRMCRRLDVPGRRLRQRSTAGGYLVAGRQR